MQVVWFKRDLRIEDHEPLFKAAQCGDVLPLYVIEHDYWQLPDTNYRQWQFLKESLEALQLSFAALHCPLVVRTGDVVDVLNQLHAVTKIDALWSHEETGNLWTYSRDKKVAVWCKDKGVRWHEFAQHGVIRNLKSRRGWAGQWDRQMRSPVLSVPPALTASVVKHSPDGLQKIKAPHAFKGVLPAGTGQQPGGRTSALALLDSFLNQRGERYQKEMSSPALAEQSCSRLSAHLALGSVSIKEVFQAVEEKQRVVRTLPSTQRGMWGKSLHSYAGRLHWHCHFIQKLEDQPRHEVSNVHRGYDGLREPDFNRNYFNAWCGGQTGFPFIDACMRYLNATGWINFRMRAMLMSFAAYHLWLHWREPGLYLAKAFTDYEPGIHWNQVQMQSGTTGINTVRIYNPVKQSYDQDAQGQFIRRWVPELTRVPDTFVHEPWKMNEAQQRKFGCVADADYPAPLVDHMDAARRARDQIYAIRRHDEFREIADRIQEKHGSRKSGIKVPARGNKIIQSPQLDLKL